MAARFLNPAPMRYENVKDSSPSKYSHWLRAAPTALNVISFVASPTFGGSGTSQGCFAMTNDPKNASIEGAKCLMGPCSEWSQPHSEMNLRKLSENPKRVPRRNTRYAIVLPLWCCSSESAPNWKRRRRRPRAPSAFRGAAPVALGTKCRFAAARYMSAIGRISTIVHPARIGRLARVLRCGVPVDAKSLRNGVGCLALRGSSGNLLAEFNRKPRPADLNALRFGASHACFRAVTNFLCLKLGQRRKQRQQDVADQLVIGREVRFGIRV